MSYRIPSPAANTSTELLRRSQNGVCDLDSYAERNHGLPDWERRAGGQVARSSK